MKLFEYYTQQGQTQLHRLRMFKQLVFTTISFSFFIALLSFITCCYLYGLFEPIIWLLAYGKAWIRLTLFSFLPHDVLNTNYLYQQGSFILTNDKAVYTDPYWILRLDVLKTMLFQIITPSLILGSLSFIGITLYWFLSGKKHKHKKILKGQQLVKPARLKKLIKQYGTSPIQLAGIPLPHGAECEHIMITGTTGAGKTNAIQSLGSAAK